MSKQKQSRGSALLTALFIMTLVAIVATAMSLKVQLDIYRTRLIIIHNSLYLASQTVSFWALSELNNEKNHFAKVSKQGTVATFPKVMENIQAQVQISGALYDLQAQYNLNNLTDKKGILVFTNLLNQSGITMSGQERLQMALAIQDWLTPYDPSRGKDIFASYYQSQKPAYNASHQLMKSDTEFRLIKGVSSALYLGLEPWFTVLPETETLVNINTASKELLMALGLGIPEQKINTLLSARENKEIEKLNEISEMLVAMGFPFDQLTTESMFYLSVAHVQIDEFSLVVYTLLKRYHDKNKTLKVRIVRESVNGFS